LGIKRAGNIIFTEFLGKYDLWGLLTEEILREFPVKEENKCYVKLVCHDTFL